MEHAGIAMGSHAKHLASLGSVAAASMVADLQGRARQKEELRRF